MFPPRGAPERSARAAPGVVRRTLSASAAGAMLAGLVAALPRSAPAQEQQVWRCERNGRISFQQQPCPDGARSEDVTPDPSNVAEPPPRASPPERPPAPVASASPSAPAAATLPARPTTPPMPYAQDAEACLDYLRPFLRDPRSAYVSAPRREGRVLFLTVHAGNFVGGVVTRPAACEFVNGVVDRGWTRIQMERLGWFKGPVYVQPQSSPPSARRIVYDDIELPDAAELSRR